MSDNTSLTVGFKADTSGFKKGMDDVINKLNELNKQLVDNQYKQRDSNKVISDAKKELRNIQKEIGENGEANEEQRNRIEALNRTIEEETLKLSQLRTEQASLRSCISQTTGELVNNNEQWSTLKATIANLASDTLQRLGAALRNVVADIIRTGEEFSASISKVAAISGATQEELEQLEEAARAYGASTMFSATEAADALQYMALAGWNAEQSIEGLPAVLDLAASSGMDLGKASDIVTDYITAFGLSVDDAARFVDIMSYAMSNSNTTTEMLGEAYKNCAATARSMGFSVEETTAALMTMANAGVKGGEAGTTLNTLMTRLATDTKGCASALEEYGVRIYDSEGNMKSLSDILSGLIGVWDTLTQKQQANLSKMIAGTNQYSGFQTLMQGMSDKAKAAGMSFDDYTEALENCMGTASKMSGTMADNLSGDIRIMNSAFDELKLKIFEGAEQPLRNIVKLVTNGVVPAIDSIIQNLNKVLPVIVSCATAMATLKFNLAIGGLITKLTTALKGMTAAEVVAEIKTKLLSWSMKELSSSNVIGLVLTGITSLASAFLTLSAMQTNYADDIERTSSTLMDNMQKMRELKENYDKTADSVAGEAEMLNILKEEYDELRGKTELTAAEKKRLDEVAGEIAQSLGTETQALKDQSGAYRDLTVDIDEYIKSLEKQALTDYYEESIKQAAVNREKAEKDMKEADRRLLEESNNLWLMLTKYQRDHNESYISGISKYNSEIEKKIAVVKRAENAATKAKAAWSSAQGDIERYTDDLKALGNAADTAGQSTDELNEDLDEINKKIAESTEHISELSKEQSQLTQQSSSLRGEMNSLAGSLAQLERGETLSLDTILQLIEKYPDYTAQLIAATGNVDLQKEALKALFDAKKAEYILTQQAAIDNINASDRETWTIINNTLQQINAKKALLSVMDKIEEKVKAVQELKGLGDELKQYKRVLEQNAENRSYLQQRIDWVQGLNYEDFVSGKSKSVNTTTGSGSSRGSGSTGKSDSKWTMDSRGVYAEGNSYLDAYTKWMDRAKAVGKLTADEEIQFLREILKREALTAEEREQVRQKLYAAEEKRAKAAEDSEKERAKAAEDAEKEKYNARRKEIQDYLTWIDRQKALGNISERKELEHLERLVKYEDLTADERYNIELRLHNLQKDLADKAEAREKERAEREAKAVEEAEQRKKEARELGKAALDKLIDDEISKHEAASNAAKKWADKEKAALDEVVRKRRQASEDEKRQNEIDLIDLKLRSGHLSEFEERELYRRKQDILNERYEAEFEQSVEDKKTEIDARADSVVSANDQAIKALQNSKTSVADRVAYLNGTQSYDQRVKNNTVTQNVTIVQNGLSGDQLVQRVLKELGARP